MAKSKQQPLQQCLKSAMDRSRPRPLRLRQLAKSLMAKYKHPHQPRASRPYRRSLMARFKPQLPLQYRRSAMAKFRPPLQLRYPQQQPPPYRKSATARSKLLACPRPQHPQASPPSPEPLLATNTAGSSQPSAPWPLSSSKEVMNKQP